MKSLSVPKIISECRELVKLYHINRSGPGFLRHSVVSHHRFYCACSQAAICQVLGLDVKGRSS